MGRKRDGGTVPRDTREVFATPRGVFETQNIDVKPQGGLHVLDAQNRLTAFNSIACDPDGRVP
jgi:hypothetical protein